MAKPGSAAYRQAGASRSEESASDLFQQLGETGLRLLALQAQAASAVLLDSTVRYAQLWSGFTPGLAWRQWQRMQRSQVRNAAEPLQAWMEAAAGLQAVIAAAAMQAWALAVFPGAGDAAENRRHPERRVNAVVIPFPDRRRGMLR